MLGEGLPERTQQFLEPMTIRASQSAVGGDDQLVKRQPQQFVHEGVLAGEPAVHGSDAARAAISWRRSSSHSG